MDLHNAAFVVAGMVGSTVAIAHGFIMLRLMVRPIHELSAEKHPTTIQKLVTGLLHFRTFNWFVSGLVLIFIAYSFGRKARLVTGLLVGTSYLFGALVNLCSTRGGHVGWFLYAAAVVLIIYGLSKPGG